MEYDAIVIGSGMGGLTCASLLAQLEGKKVLVLERHFTPGGYTHMFKRNAVYILVLRIARKHWDLAEKISGFIMIMTMMKFSIGDLRSPME